jgi:ABC-type multidrug transport system fused ATPase/permease subunit
MNTYQQNIAKHQQTVEGLNKKLTELSWSRLVVFVFAVFLIVLFASNGLAVITWLLVLVGGGSFAFLMKQHNQVAYQKQHATFLAEINEQEILRQQNQLATFPDGHTFIRRDHPYVADLDVFGSHSLYQLINRTTTEAGRERLADWLSEATSSAEIIDRQRAVQELTPQLAWRQEFQAAGQHFTNRQSDFRKLLAWLEEPVHLLPHATKYRVASVILAVLTTLALLYHMRFAYASDFLLNTLPLIVMIVINFLFLKRFKYVAEEIIDRTHENVKTLGGYQALILKIEAEEFESPRLQQLQAAFRQDNFSASQEINTLKKILEIAQLKGTESTGDNKLYPIINILWLIDPHWIIRAERWKTRNRAYVKAWADAVGTFEALSSLAGFAHANPTYTFPEVREGACTIRFTALGHPLLPPDRRVCNDFNLQSSDNIVMITGSNMAGKSTFLRTVGANLVLALMGAPCCATSGEVTVMQLFSSMRTQDNLEEGVSSFYAELKKIEQLLKLIQSGQPVFFLLDEMFKGTNSKDRHRGGFSLIKQLEELNAFGIISTHDLELAEEAGKHALVTNYSFNSDIREGEMTFDYHLTPGLCRDFNASELMRRSGIKIMAETE